MTDNWQYEQDQVLKDRGNYWWHILDRYQSVDTGTRKYELADATHTEYKTVHADDVENGGYESLEWCTTSKPAAVNGFRVNGVLCGPAGIEFWKDRECIHEFECPDCGAERPTEIDVIRSYQDGELAKTMPECRECGNCWTDGDKS